MILIAIFVIMWVAPIAVLSAILAYLLDRFALGAFWRNRALLAAITGSLIPSFAFFFVRMTDSGSWSGGILGFAVYWLVLSVIVGLPIANWVTRRLARYRNSEALR